MYYCGAQLGATVYLCESCQLSLSLSLTLEAAQSPNFFNHSFISLASVIIQSNTQFSDKQPQLFGSVCAKQRVKDGDVNPAQ